MLRRILGAGMPSCLRLDVGGLSKVLASRGVRRVGLAGATCGVASRLVDGRPAPAKLGNQSTHAVETRRRRRARVPPPAGNDGRAPRPFTPSSSSHPLDRAFSRASPAGDPPAQVTHRSYGGAPGHPGRKTADLPENPGLPYQAARRPVKVSRAAGTPRYRARAFPRDARRDAASIRTASLRSAPAPKSAPVSQDSKRRGGSPAFAIAAGSMCTGARGRFPFPLEYSSCTWRVNDPRVFNR